MLIHALIAAVIGFIFLFAVSRALEFLSKELGESTTAFAPLLLVPMLAVAGFTSWCVGSQLITLISTLR